MPTRVPSYLKLGITATDNDAIDDLMFVCNRVNYLMQPRPIRAFPLV